MSLRCAGYARYSTDKQNPVSVEDQLRKCGEFAERQGWTMLEEHTYADRGVSGATDDRSGLRSLLRTATSPSCPFEVILIDDTSRLSRRMVDSLHIFEQLEFAGIRLVFVSQGIDTSSEQAEVLLATHGIVDSLYIRELAKKVHRGVEGRALKGLHTGGRCFGYRSVPIEDPTKRDAYGRPVVVGVRLEIEPNQARVVRRIFEEYPAGASVKTIARRLNQDGVPSPAPYRGQRHPSWAPSAISVILHNDRYRGVVIWNKTRKVRDPRTGRRLQRTRPKSEWKIMQAPHLRIVSDELWHRVQDRLLTLQVNFGTKTGKGLCTRSYPAPYLFSGFLKCGLCGSNLVLVSGRGQADWAKYGCPLHHNRGICSNALLLRRKKLEEEILGGLQREVLREDVAAYALREFERQLRARLQDSSEEVGAIRKRQEKLKDEVANLACVIAEGHQSPALLAELSRREKELCAISDDLRTRDQGGFEGRLEEIDAFVRKRLQDVRSLLVSDVPRAKAELAKHCTAIVIQPEGNTYRINGHWDLLGGRSGGAGGGNCTQRPGLISCWR